MEDVRLHIMSPESDVLELRIAGEVDLATVEPVRTAAERAARSGDYRLIVFDLEEVTFIDSTGLHELADSSRMMAAAGGAGEVRCSAPNLRKVLSILGLDRVFTIMSSPGAAPVAATA